MHPCRVVIHVATLKSAQGAILGRFVMRFSAYALLTIDVAIWHTSSISVDGKGPEPMTLYVAYYRVSTDKQGRSGLGLEAQRASVASFLREGDRVISEFTEVESGRHDNRPQMAAALTACRAHKATLLIAKLDRLSRSVEFIARLMNGDVPFVACDMPHADPFRLHIEAAIAEEERRKISIRIREALAAAKARGVKLGGYRGAPLGPLLEAARARANTQNDDTHAAILYACASGRTWRSYKSLAKWLCSEGYKIHRKTLAKSLHLASRPLLQRDCNRSA